MGYSFRLAARERLYAPSLRQWGTLLPPWLHLLQLAGTRNWSSMKDRFDNLTHHERKHFHGTTSRSSKQVLKTIWVAVRHLHPRLLLTTTNSLSWTDGSVSWGEYPGSVASLAFIFWGGVCVRGGVGEARGRHRNAFYPITFIVHNQKSNWRGGGGGAAMVGPCTPPPPIVIPLPRIACLIKWK